MAMIARSLLRRIPQQERSAAVQDVVRSLGQRGSGDIELAVSLLAEHPDDVARRALLKHLRSMIEAGHGDQILTVCTRDAGIGNQLLRDLTEQLVRKACQLQADSVTSAVVAIEDAVPRTDGNLYSMSAADGLISSSVSVKSLLNYARRSVLKETSEENLELLLKASLVYAGTSDVDICMNARDMLFSLLSAKLITSESRVNLLWRCIQTLATSTSQSSHRGIAYSIRLRWTSTKGFPNRLLLDENYWQILRQGLQHGDTEHRKQCLAILRRSVAMAMQDQSTRHAVCSAEHASLALNDVLDQYERYCTVCETILLGRYLNQIVECESDLNALSHSQSAVRSEWLYVLFAAALAPRVQDSIRKFMGSWLMRSAFQPDTSDDSVRFFRNVFLPWATLGSLFTATLRRQDERLSCGHGERLASYVASLLRHNLRSNIGNTKLLDAVIDVTTARRCGNFPYTLVYLLEGLGRAFETTPEMTLQPAQLASLAELSLWPALPEVARDYVHVRCIKLCGDSLLRSADGLEVEAVINAIRRWNEIQAKLGRSSGQDSSEANDPIASWESEMSSRDAMELHAVGKCQSLRERLDLPDMSTSSEVAPLVEDIWSDLEYLEYPKRLLIDMPSLILNPRLVALAITSDDMSAMIANMVRKLQQVSANRLYLLSPLVSAIRDAALALPDADKVIPLEDFITHYAERLPNPTMDLQLEDATTLLLQSVTPDLGRFGYEYYFGDRESLGIAALLDLVSRLGHHHHDLVQSMFNRLVQRWGKQKVPPPTVSPWKSTLQLQVMLLCCEQIVPSLSTSALLHVLKELHYVLSIEPLPRYRYLLSWMIARIYLKHKDLRIRVLNDLATKNHHSNPKYLASLMKIGVTVAKLDDSGADFGTQLASSFIALAASSKVIIRHEAQWQFPILMDYARAKGWTEVTDSPAFTTLDEYIRSLARFDDPPLERQLDRLDPVADHTLANLAEGTWFGLDSIESSTCGRVDFVKLYDADAKTSENKTEAFPASCMPLGDPIERPTTQSTPQGTGAASPPINTKQELTPSKAGESRALQTKGTAYLASGADDSTEQPTRRNPLIVVASLIDNPYNLGGLSRVSEIFGASELHLQNQNVTANKDFATVAVSSHLHFPIFQLSAPGVPAYLAEKRQEGWTVVGIEQTDRSVFLGAPGCVLPEKVVLVMGSEREGIPALVLAECGVLVEIPQVGVTRSLNVQTAAGIVLFEYARQHGKALQ